MIIPPTTGKTLATGWMAACSGAKALIWISLLFGVAFTGISLPAVLAVPDEISKGNHAVLLVLD